MDKKAAPELTVLIVDDRRFVREGLRRLLLDEPDIGIVGEADTENAALDLARRFEPGIVLLELSMPGTCSFDLIQRLKSRFPQMAVLGLSMYTDEQYAIRALRAGADGCILKDSTGDELVDAIRKVGSGGIYASPALAGCMAMEINGQVEGPVHTQLSNREFEVCRLIVAGERLTSIAEMLHLSVKTVSTHKTRALEKLNLDSAAALVKYSLTHQLFDERPLGQPER